MSSNPSTDTSAGTRKPASFNALIAPMAETSLNANSAVNFSRAGKEFLGGGVADLRRREIALELGTKPCIDVDAPTPGSFQDRVESDLGVGAECLPFEHRYPAMPELVQMADAQFGGVLVIEYHVRDAFDVLVP